MTEVADTETNFQVYKPCCDRTYVIGYIVAIGSYRLRSQLLSRDSKSHCKCNDRSMRSGAELTLEIQLTDWSTAGEQGKTV